MIKLQNLCFPDPEICNVRELYFHETDTKLTLDGYFNLLYLEKRKKYTAVRGLALKLSAPGYRRLIVYCDRKYVRSFSLDPADASEHIFQLPYREVKGKVLYLEFEKAPGAPENKEIHNSCKSLSGAFYGVLPEEDVRPVNIGIDICTFRREAYVLRNLKQMMKGLLGRGEEEAGRHTGIYLIDNGQTLGAYTPLQEFLRDADPQKKVRIIPNKNAGGAGGFTRGMLEILKDKESRGMTHVLLMDDDAVVDPETVVRIYGLLSTVKEEWKDVTVGGAMLREDHPEILYCAGEWWEKGRICYSVLNRDLRQYEHAAAADLVNADHEFDRYSGWWCCCYSLNTVRKDNLPLPLFLHHDDIEFGIRNREKGVIFLNGVGIWHRTPVDAFPGATTYYDVRNNLIELALHGNAKLNTYRVIMFKALFIWTLKLYYPGTRLAYLGLLDFLKGPERLGNVDPEKLNNRIRSMALKLKPLEELREDMTPEEYRQMSEEIRGLCEEYAKGIDLFRKRDVKPRLIHLLTLNGWLLRGDKKISLSLSSDSPYRNYRKQRILLYELNSGKGAVQTRSFKEIYSALKLFVRSMIAVREEVPKAAERWRKNYHLLTNKEQWEKYLGL